MDCKHHWMLESPRRGKDTVQGECKHCGETRDFPAYEDDYFHQSRWNSPAKNKERSIKAVVERRQKAAARAREKAREKKNV